jgi:hypothetical protein
VGSFTNWSVLPMGAGLVQVVSGNNLPQGNYCAYFKNDSGSLSQTISTLPGDYYFLSLAAIEFQGTNYVGISLNGSLLTTLNFTNPAQSIPITYQNNQGTYNSNFESFSYIFQATSITSTLKFTYIPQEIYTGMYPNLSGPFSGSGGLDAISVVAVPEPSTVALLGMGLGALTGRWRRKP